MLCGINLQCEYDINRLKNGICYLYDWPLSGTKLRFSMKTFLAAMPLSTKHKRERMLADEFGPRWSLWVSEFGLHPSHMAKAKLKGWTRQSDEHRKDARATEGWSVKLVPVYGAHSIGFEDEMTASTPALLVCSANWCHTWAVRNAKEDSIVLKQLWTALWNTVVGRRGGSANRLPVMLSEKVLRRYEGISFVLPGRHWKFHGAIADLQMKGSFVNT